MGRLASSCHWRKGGSREWGQYKLCPSGCFSLFSCDKSHAPSSQCRAAPLAHSKWALYQPAKTGWQSSESSYSSVPSFFSPFSSCSWVFALNFRTTYLLALQSLHVDVPKQLKLPMLKSEVIIWSPELCITSYSLSLNFTTLHPSPMAKIWASFLIFLLPYLPLRLVDIPFCA